MLRITSLFQRLALLVLLIALPMAGIEVWNQLHRRQTQEMELHEQAERLVSLLDAEYAHVVEGIRQVMEAIRWTRIVRERDERACPGYMTALTAQFPSHLDFYVTDHQGTIWCATEPAGVGFSAGDRLHFRRALETNAFATGEYMLRRSDQRPILPFALPYQASDGTLGGAVMAAIDVGWLDDYLAKKPLPPNTAVLLADRNGVVLARRPEIPGVVGKPLPEPYLPLLQAGGGGTAEMVGLDGVRRIQASSQLSASPERLLFIVGLDKAEAMQEINRTMGWSLALLATVFTFSIVAVWWGGQHFLARPIGTLVAAANRWRAGDHDARARLPDDGTEIAVLGSAFDAMADSIEAQFQALQRAHSTTLQAEARLAAIVETAVDAMVVIDEGGTIQSFNPAAERLFGYRAEEAVRRDVKMLMPEPYHSAHDGYLANYRRTGERKIIGIGREVEGRRKDGSTFPLELAIAEWSVEGQRFFTGIMRDITERNRARDALRSAKNEADRANLAKSKFLAATSHDLRQPVQSLVLFQAALTERLAGHPVSPLLEVMGQALSGLRMLLDSLLDVSKLDAGLIVPQPVDMPLMVLLERLGAEYLPQAVAKQLRLRVVGTNAVVRSDPVLLERILRNLVENALRYTEHGGVLLGCRRHGDRLRIAVVDSGIGIDPERQGDIFEEFIQVGNPERDRAKGLGLGLAVVRRLVRLLGHELKVRSRPGHGSTFSVEVPLVAHVAPAGPPVSTPAREEDRRGLILVIDDEVLVRMGLQAMLEGWGYRVLTAGSVEDAIRHIESGEWPQAILADYRLRGGETGLDAIRAVHARLNSPVPATVITGDTAPERLVEARAGGFALMHKPVAAFDLHKTVVGMLQAGAD